MKRNSLLLLAVLSLVTLCVAPLMGPLGILSLFASEEAERVVLYQVRIPRVIFGFLVGGALAMCGAVYQAIFRNPLASPFSLGVSGGASVGAALAVFFRPNIPFLGFATEAAFAASGALLTVLLMFGLARGNRIDTSIGLLLAGVVLSYFCSSIVALVQYVSDYAQLFQLSRWMLGSLQIVGYQELTVIGVLCVAALIFLFRIARKLDLISISEDFAATRGVDVGRTIGAVTLVTSILIGCIVSLCGVIGFVGVIVPHFCRMLLGARHATLLPSSFLVGGILVCSCDLLGRMVLPPYEIPVGVFTALVGGPAFVAILLKGRLYMRGD